MASRLLAFSLASALAALSVPAIAGGAAPSPVEAVPVMPAQPGHDWSGPSLGLQLGYGSGDTSGAAVFSDDAGFVGLRANYDVDLGDYVVGGGVQYDAMNVEVGGTEIESMLRLGARGGVDLGRNWFYGTAGLARVSTDSTDVGDSNGFFLGVGVEALMTGQFTLGAEVLYHDFRNFDLEDLEAQGASAGVSLNVRF